MREYFTYGSVRGAAGDGGPYRDPCPDAVLPGQVLAYDKPENALMPKAQEVIAGRQSEWTVR